MRVFGKLNKTQIKAIADLLLEIGKWLLLSVVFNALLSGATVRVGLQEISIALLLAFILILLAIWILKEVKDK